VSETDLYVSDILGADPLDPETAVTITSMQQFEGAVERAATDKTDFWIAATGTHCLRHMDGVAKYLEDNPDKEILHTSFERWYEEPLDSWFIRVETIARPKKQQPVVHPMTRSERLGVWILDRLSDWVVRGMKRWG